MTAKPHCYEFPRPALTADICVFARQPEAAVLLIRRANDPFEGKWALPGGFLEVGNETIEQCACRELAEETGLDCVAPVPFGIYSDPERDPRGHVVSVAFYCLVEGDIPEAKAASDADRVVWLPLTNIAGLAFDHDRIVADGWAAATAGMGLAAD